MRLHETIVYLILWHELFDQPFLNSLNHYLAGAKSHFTPDDSQFLP